MPKSPGRPLGAVIRELRERAGVTQRELARAMGIDQPGLARIEASRRRGMQFATMCRLAEHLGVSLDQIAIAAGLIAHLPPGEPRRAPVIRSASLARARKALASVSRALDELDGA